MGRNAKTLKREVGNWVSGDRFWDREVELATLKEYIAEGANVLLVAPRRVGKTSLMHEAAEQLTEAGYYTLIVDLQKGRHAADAVVELSLAAREVMGKTERVKEFVRGLVGKVDEIAVDELTIKLRDSVGTNWQGRGSRLFDVLARDERPVVLFLDEFPILVNRILKGAEGHISPRGRAEADAFISWIRAMSQEHRGRIRMVVAGSIGIEPVLASAGLSATLNTFVPLHLEPWEPEIAVGALRALAAEYKLEFEAGAAEAMVERLGSCVPHHVQMFFTYALEDARKRRAARVSIEDVAHVYQRRMLSTRGHAELSHMEERLRMVLAPEELPLALDLLTETSVTGVLTAEAANLIAQAAGLERPRESLRTCLGILEHDGYLYSTGQGYVFLSGLLRDWWKARFQSTYQPPGA